MWGRAYPLQFAIFGVIRFAEVMTLDPLGLMLPRLHKLVCSSGAG